MGEACLPNGRRHGYVDISFLRKKKKKDTRRSAPRLKRNNGVIQ